MSKIVKKMKIMQPGGTLSDYVSIGAEAENINVDGESVETKLGKKPYYYDTVVDMKADMKLKAGDMAVTLGYYEANDGGHSEYVIIDDDTLVDDGGSIHVLTNGLRAKLIINNCINVKQFGCSEDNNIDNTTFINNAIQYAKTNNINKVFIPAGTYLINGTIILTNNLNLYGAGKNQTQLLNGNDGVTSIPMITTENYADLTEDVKYISLHDMNITSNGIRSKYDIELFNISYSNIYNIYFNRLNIISNNENDLHGLLIERNTSCQSESVVNKIYNCQIRNGKIKLVYTTDNYIDKNEIWAPNCQDCALELLRSFNNSITNNQIVGGFIYGGIKFSHSSLSPVITGNKIVNNYFDGSYELVESANAIDIETNIQDTLISNNLFYVSKKNSIYVNDDYFIRRCIITNNIFQESNKLDNYYNDIYSINTSNEGNIISNNTFYNNNKTNKGYAIAYKCTSSNLISKSIITNNSVEYPSGYTSYNLNKYHIILKNNSDFLNVDSDYIVAQQTSSQALTSDGVINLDTTIASSGNGLSISSNAVTVGNNSGIKNLCVSGFIVCYGTLNKNKNIQVLKNNVIVYLKNFQPTTNNFDVNIDCVIPVSAGDVITIKLTADENNTITTVGSSSTNQFTFKAVI